MRHLKALVLEALVLALVGLLFALAANALSPRGLRLARNYFPNLPLVQTNAASTNALDLLAMRLAQHGIKVVSSNEVAQLFRDPGYEQGLIVFVDARSDNAYQSSHVPGAWQLDRYRPGDYMPSVLAACSGAQRIVVYCNGKSCDDSEFAAIMLSEAGIPADTIVVYGGGISEWTNAMPFEVGPRGSGQIIEPKR